MDNSLKQYAVVIGIDWADKKHDICLLDREKSEPVYQVIKHSPTIIDDWVLTLQKKYPATRIALAIELTRGPIISALLKYDFIDIYPINPQALSQYRKAFRVSGAKDDPNDAFLQMDMLLKHADKLRKLTPDIPEIRALAQLVAQRRNLVEDKVRINNRLTHTLKAYYPLILELFEDRDSIVFFDFLERWPTMKELKRVRPSTLKKFFIGHKSYRGDVIERRIKMIKNALPLTNDQGVIQPSVMMAQAMICQLRPLVETIALHDKTIKQLCRQQQDYAIFDGLPGAGPQLAPRLLAAFGTQRERYQSSNEVVQYVGVAPVTISSGKSHVVRWRWACPKFIRQTFIEWANKSIRYSFWARAYYEQQLAKGKPHQFIIRSLAFKWIRIVFRCWKDRKPYDETKYLMTLKKKRSPLLKVMSN